jgi:DNA-binding CsgD family transcriptional regulator
VEVVDLRNDLERFNLSNSQISFLIEQWICAERDRTILKDRLINGMTFERIAEKHDMSVRQTKNIVYRAMERLVTHL